MKANHPASKSPNQPSVADFLTFGADPEVFLYDVEQKRIVSAIDVLQRNKYDPIILGPGVNFYFDNCMAEFTVRPGSSKEDFVNSVRESLTLIQEFLNKNFGGRIITKIQAAHEFDSEFLKTDEANAIGCNPEFDAWTLSEVTPPNFSGSLRSAGGHFATANNNKKAKEGDFLTDFQTRIDYAKLLDYFLAVPFVLVDNDPTSLLRKKLYGRSPGMHRPKPEYGSGGLEYRVLSNFWISSPKLVELVCDLGMLAVSKIKQGETEKVFKTVKFDMMAACIRENNKELASEIVDMLKFPKNLVIRLNQLRNVTWNPQEEWGIETAPATVNATK